MYKDLEEDAVDAAARVLETNWTGRYTVPATGLYPHQWSWDSAFIAIGTRHREPARARAELVTLLDAQWPDGRVPQIVYDARRDDDYAPGAEFWRAGRTTGPVSAGPMASGRSRSGAALSGLAPSGLAPSGLATSGLVQPPVHAWAAWLVHCADPAGSAREGFLARMYPRLVRWHEYLHGPRAGAVGLPVAKHPWETGTDNSPLWDTALERVPPDARTAIRRPDLRHAGTGERPGSRDYRRYYHLAEAYRDAGCADDVPIGFAMVCPLFTSVLAVSELALARMAVALSSAEEGAPSGGDGGAGAGGTGGAGAGGDAVGAGAGASGNGGAGTSGDAVGAGGNAVRARGDAHEMAAARVVAAMDEHLWDDELGLYVALDDTTGEPVRRATVNGLVPLLLAGGPAVTGARARTKERPATETTAEAKTARPATETTIEAKTARPTTLAAGRAERLLSVLTGPGFLGGGRFLPSTSREDLAFDPALYWRGPAWFNMSWLLLRAVRALGRDDLAARLWEQFAVAAPEEFPEYVDPGTGAGRGTRQFSWTAALMLDAALSREWELLPGP